GYTESFTALLELLDDQRFARNVLPAEEQLARVMVRRLKSDLVDSDGRRIYPLRRLEALRVEYSDEERHIRRLLDAFIASREADTGGGKAASHFVHQLLRKRLSSSPASFASTLAKHVETIEKGRGADAGGSRLDERILRRAIARTEEDYADDEARERAEHEAVEEVSRRLRPLSQEGRRMVEELRSWAERSSHRPDAKARAILAWLGEHIRPGGRWSDTRVILFTEYRTTQGWLHEILASHGYGGERLALLYGGMDSEDREAIKAAFQADPDESPVRILLATDAASEGIDLQNHCNLLIHVEIPYNPNVMEQRNGRIDRHGQKQREVVIWHPVDSFGGHGDDILRALRKLDAMRADMGSVNPVIAPQLPDLLEGRRRELDTRAAEARMERARRFVKVERRLRERISKLHERLTITRHEQHLTPERVERAVRAALTLAGQPNLTPVSLPGVPEHTLFRMPPLTGSWSRCLEGLEHPYTGRTRPITFDHAVAEGRDDVVLVHLQHRLVQMSLRLLRAEVWARDDVKRLHRVTMRVLPDEVLEGPAVAVVSRLVVTGGGHHRLHEELTEAGGYLGVKAFRRESRVGTIRKWLDASQPGDVPDSLFDALRARFEKHRDSILATVEARSKDRLRYLAGTIARRVEREVADIRTVLTDLEENLRSELAKDAEPEQLSLFTEDERTQLRRDRAALEARLARIPEEIERETRAIQERHSSPKEHTFPVAVVFLVPRSSIHGGRQP
ncbi:MAG TPA: helicase, partial [Polyangiaceae bacterium]|nr:helicase [Polyangiaceae bacterium]